MFLYPTSESKVVEVGVREGPERFTRLNPNTSHVIMMRLRTYVNPIFITILRHFLSVVFLPAVHQFRDVFHIFAFLQARELTNFGSHLS